MPMGELSQIHSISEAKKCYNLYPGLDFFVKSNDSLDESFFLGIFAFIICIDELSFLLKKGKSKF